MFKIVQIVGPGDVGRSEVVEGVTADARVAGAKIRFECGGCRVAMLGCGVMLNPAEIEEDEDRLPVPESIEGLRAFGEQQQASIVLVEAGPSEVSGLDHDELLNLHVDGRPMLLIVGELVGHAVEARTARAG